MKEKLVYLFTLIGITTSAGAVSIVANVNGNPITDVDITERVKIMPVALDNREKAKEAIIDDYVKLEYAKSFKIDPTEKEVVAAMKDNQDNQQMKLSTKAKIAWQIVVMHTIVPNISVSQKEIDEELSALEREKGLPLSITFLRLVNIPGDSYEKLEKPKSCDDAIKMVKNLGGDPQKVTAVEYELAPEIRELLAGLAPLTWSVIKDKNAVLVCNSEKTKEWGKLDDIVRQNATYKRAMFNSDQLLKQLRRKAAITK